MMCNPNGWLELGLIRLNNGKVVLCSGWGGEDKLRKSWGVGKYGLQRLFSKVCYADSNLCLLHW